MEIKKIIKDIRLAKNELVCIEKSITVFGSARFDSENFYVLQAQNLAKKAADLGYAVITGGGGGIMEGANKGAWMSAKSHSVGFNIVLPFEQESNKYLTKSVRFSEFPARKAALIYKSEIFVIFPGGFGTLDELFEVLVLVQVGFKKAKIYLFGAEFWNPLMKFLTNSLLENQTIKASDLNLITITNDIDEIVSDLQNTSPIEKVGAR